MRNQEQLRILHIVSNISVRSGIMSVIMSYYRNIDKSNIQFDFLYFDERPETYHDEINQLGGNICRIVRPSNFQKFPKELRNFFSLHYGIYPIIHLHDAFLVGFFSGCRKIGGVKKIIVHAHATKFADSKMGEIRNRLLSVATKFVPDNYFACSVDAGNYIFGKRFNREGIVINNAIDLRKFTPEEELDLRQSLGLENKFVIGHVGNFIPQKNHVFLLEIFRQVEKKNNDAVLVLVGDGYLKNEIEEKCKQYRIEDKVLFLGVRKDVNRLMRIFDCFLLPSLYEGLGIVLIEAQASGIPCVFSSEVPKDANVIEENNRILDLDDEPSVWADTVMVQSRKLPPVNLKERITLAGFNISKESEKLERRYMELWQQ